MATVDTSELEEDIRRVLRNRSAARRAVTEGMAKEVVEFIVKRAPRDTNRYVRAWIEAGNAAGVTDLPVPPLNKSSKLNDIIVLLLKQIGHIDDRVFDLAFRNEQTEGVLNAWYTRKGRKEKTWALGRRKNIKDNEREIRRLGRRREKVVEQLEQIKDDSAVIIMDAGRAFSFGSDKGYGFGARFKKAGKRGGPKKLITARALVQTFGGTGQIVERTDTTIVVLHNREPHASFVEQRTRLLASARIRVGKFGLAVHKGKYLKEALSGTTLAA